MSWTTARLKDIAPSQASGRRFSPDESVWHLTLDQIESNTGQIVNKQTKPAGEAGNSTYVFDEENVLYSKLRPYLNKVVCPQEAGIATTELVPLKPRPEIIDRDYLTYYLRSPDFVRFASATVAGVKMPRIIMEKFWNHELPLPPLTEQRRIAEILDQADALRKQRAEADDKAARILPALFYQMFGDPATNPKRWRERELREVIQSVDSGWSAKGEARTQLGKEYGVLKVSAVTSGRFLPDEHKAVPNVRNRRDIITPKRGDLLFSRANTRQLIAASCVVEEDHPFLFLPDKLWRLVVRKDLARPLFLKELFWTDATREKFRSVSGGSSGSMLNISKESMLKIVAPIPPVELQARFEELGEKLIGIVNREKKAHYAIDTLWKGLLHRAFTSELTAKWREKHMTELLQEMEHQARALG